MKKQTTTDFFDPYSDLDSKLDSIEKDFGLLSSSLDHTEKRMSTGLLVLDLVAGKGLVAGGWYTILGAESSAKSTTAHTMMANSLNSGVPVLSLWDFEGSTEVSYLENIMKAQGIKVPIEEVFGIRDPLTHKYVVRPRVRIYFENVAERFFDFLAKLERSLPDKVKIGQNFYYIYPHTKENQSLLKGEYDLGFLKKYNKFRVPAPDGLPQAFLIVDSYPAMLPEGLDVDDPSAAMAMQARMFSQQMQRVKGKMRAKRITVVGMNQLRERPAVKYGSPVYEPCFVGDTPILLSDGTTDTIQNLVQNKRQVDVLSLNISNGEISKKPVIDWKANGYRDCSELLIVSYESSGKTSSFTCTANHKIWTQDGWKAAKNLSIKDTLSSSGRDRLLRSANVVSVTEPSVGHDVYDLTVLDNHTYFVGDADNAVAVSNCGQAVRFYCMAGDTLLFTNSGIRQAQDCDARMLLYGKDNAEQPNVFGKIDKKRVITIGTEHGYTLKAARSHKLWGHHPQTGLTGWMTMERVSYSTCTVQVVGGQDMFGQINLEQSLARKLGEYYKLSSTAVAEKLSISESEAESYGFSKNGLNKDLLPFIALTDKQTVLEFLRGMCIKDNGVYSNIGLPLDRSRHWLRMILLNLGVHTSTKECRQKDQFGRFNLIVDSKVLNDVLSNGRVIRRTWWESIDSDQTVDHEEQEMTWDANMPTSHIVTNGIMSHNSDCRLQVTARSNIYGKGMLDEEQSVDGRGDDRYRYIHVRAIKNKLSTPYLEGMMRVWVSDQHGKARGFCPFFDTHQYLSMTGQIVGKRNSMRFQGLGAFDAARPFKWEELKAMIVGTKEQKIKAQQKVGIQKPQDIRSYCKRQLADGDGFAKFFEAMKKVSKGRDED